MRHLSIKRLALCFAMLLPLLMQAQELEIRYVKMATDGGSNTNNGTSWASAKADIQDAINDLVNNNKTGEVWVAAGTYYPTETTEASSSPYYKAFKIPAGITVRGGFKPGLTAEQDKINDSTTRPKADDQTFGNGDQDDPSDDEPNDGNLDGEEHISGIYAYRTILSGSVNNSNRNPKFEWNDSKNQFTTTFYGNSYHVVWFAMNGFNSEGRANPLTKPAKLEGCVIMGGQASNSSITDEHPHNAYGGGIYMVANSFVYNCEVMYCEATRDGGGIYMDGGGIVRRTYVHDCQALGVGTEHGYGGGICEDGKKGEEGNPNSGNQKTNPVVVAQSAVTNCVGRLGGGVALKSNQDNDGRYTIVANSTLINNNTATIEGGGVYTQNGGGCASLTIVNNNCVGSGILQNGVTTGRAGGLYNRDNSYVGNCVIWGNTCTANNDVQYACSRSSNASTEKTKFYYNAVSHSDITDWTGVEKMGTTLLNETNEGTHTNSYGYPLFKNPTVVDDKPKTGYYAGYFNTVANIQDESTIATAFNWTISSESSLTYAGINTADLDVEGLTPAPTVQSFDMQFHKFNPRPSLGALVAEDVNLAPADESITYNGETYDKAFFVDPEFIYDHENKDHGEKVADGKSWRAPARFLGNVLNYISKQDYSGLKVAVFVKEGTVNNTCNESIGRVRSTAINIPSNVSIFGSFDEDLEDTDLSMRNPVHTPTIISGQLMNDYKYNVAHIININNKQNVTIDGFTLSFANAHSTLLGNSNQNGAAITITNSGKGVGDAEGEVTVHFRNIIVNNCYGDKGTVIYSDNSAATFENCIFHNNTTATLAGSGLVHGINKSDLSFNHCNVLRSVGHASYLDATTANVWKNSMFYGNLDRAQDNTNNCNAYAIEAFEGPGVNATKLTGERCMFDLRSRPLYDKHANPSAAIDLATGIPANSTYYIRNIYDRVNGVVTQETETNPNGLEYAYTSGWANGYPRMVNPTKNAGFSEEGDVTYYGRATSFEPHNDNPVVNAASTNGEPHSARQWGKDITTVITRDFGGLPDIGAVESHIASSDQIANENGNPDGQMPYGIAYYVRDYAQPGMPATYIMNNDGTYTEQTGGNLGKGNYVMEGDNYIFLDGASWQYAVSGNANYSTEITETVYVNTEWKSVYQSATTTYPGTFKIGNGTRYITISNSGSITTTTTAESAVAWTVSNSTGGNNTTTVPAFTAGNHTVSAVYNNKTYYLTFSGNNPAVSTSSSSVTLTVKNTTNYTIKNPNANRYYYQNGNNLTNTQYNTYATAWAFTPVSVVTPATWTEESVPSEDTDDRTAVASPYTVSDPLDLHVYSSITDVTNLGTANVVKYKIKQRASNDYAYDYNNTNHYIRTNTTGDDFVLISSGKENTYYIYDLTRSRYINYNTNAASPVRAETSANTAWTFTADANGGINITRGNIDLENDTPGWTKPSNNGNILLADRSASSNAEWVLVASKGYTNKYTTREQSAQGNLNGLQYAVNTVHEEFVNGGEQHQVHVGKGTYTNMTGNGSNVTDPNNLVSQPYAYEMKEGVDVLGGYPTVGNPGEQQREPKLFETILQPQTGNPYVTMTHQMAAGPNTYSSNTNIDRMVVSHWGDNANQDNTQDALSVGRVLVQPADFNVQTSWDGFTLQHGYLKTAYGQHIGPALGVLTPDNVKTAGGAGALLHGNGSIINCVVKENLILCVPRNSSMTMTGTTTAQNAHGTGDGCTTDHLLYTYHIGGAGVFMTGSTATAVVENCEIGKNQLITKAVHTNFGSTHYVPDNFWMYGAGLFQNGGNVYNTIIHDNQAATVMGTQIENKTLKAGGEANNEMILGAGAFISKGNFYNNTIVNNLSAAMFHCHENHCTFAGIHVMNKARIFNSLIADNVSHWGYEAAGWGGSNPGNGVPVSAFQDGASSRDSRDRTKVFVKYSFVDVNKNLTNSDDKIDLVSYNDTQGNDGAIAPYNTNFYLNWDQNGTDERTGSNIYNTDYIYYKPGASDTNEQNEYHLRLEANPVNLAANPCINKGTEDVKDADDNHVDIPDFDAAYSDRILDCRIDIGAYESDGSVTIAPETVGNQLVFYVTPEGYGTTNGSSPENAACAPKLQKVIDAAGRVKLQNPSKQVIVKVANSYEMFNSNTNFTYYATRTTDDNSTDTRLWSIQIPRGVEVWGGYTDVARTDHTKNSWTNTDNGFIDEGGNDARNITANPTYFDSYFYNKDMKINATTYHVVTFTDRIYDVNGTPFLKTDIFNVDGAGNVTGLKGGINWTTALSHATGTTRDEELFAHMSDIIGTDNVKTISGNAVSNRAVLDGIFVTGGNADGKLLSGSSNLNANGYGGAAIVTDYAYVRNCIVMDNKATNGGGLALTDRAIVSGSLIIENDATNKGGGLYVFENGSTLSNGITVNTTAPNGQSMDYNMAHVYTTTIAANTAQQGGGIWFTDQDEADARFNSVAVWQNQAVDQANVYGMVHPEQPTDDETLAEIYYPFSYSAIENVRASGTNNLEVASTNSAGIRFVDKNSDVGQAVVDQHNMAKEDTDAADKASRLANIQYYGLTTYSLLSSAGMPVTNYNELKNSIAISDVDILGTSRIAANNNFVEIGARALPKIFANKQLMLRLFVARPEDVDADLAERFMRLTGGAGTAAEYYSQEGSSFAYPFNSLQHALDYIKQARDGQIAGLSATDVHNLPFEILVGKGTYYPRKDLNGGTKSVWAQTFAIPEGVTMIGGFNPTGGSGTYYGRYYEPNGNQSSSTADLIDANVQLLNNGVTKTGLTWNEPEGTDIARGVKYGAESVTLPQVGTAAVGTKGQPDYVPASSDYAEAETINFQLWDIIDIAERRAMNDNNKNGIIEPWEFFNQTIISGNAVNGETDGVYHVMTAVADEDAVGHMPKVQRTNDTFSETGYQVKEEGQQIRLNGLIITGGNALTYLASALDDYGSYIFYQGAGLQVDGNRYKNHKNNGGSGPAVFHNSAAYGVGYRDIPVSITNCQFRNNVAGYGGAISSNGSLTIFGSSFEQNLAIAQTERPEDGEEWTTRVSGSSQPVSKVMYPGQGGAILATYQLSAFNTLFANNEAKLAEGEEKTIGLVKHPTFRVPVENNASATLRAAGGAIMMGSAGQHHIVNCDFVRNKANAYPAVFTMNPTKQQSSVDVNTHKYSQIINTVAWGNEVNPDMLSTFAGNTAYVTASKLMVNIGKKNRTTNYIETPGATDFYNPGFTAGNVPTKADLEVADPEADIDGLKNIWQEAAWFCAYEEGVGFKQNNTNDLRYAISYSPLKYAPAMIKEANAGAYQNCNILIVADNDSLDGPNFGTPSIKAGYDGFMEGADWSPARINRLTDNGNGWISQTVVDMKTVNFNKDSNGKYTSQGAYSVTHYIDEFPEYSKWIALGDEKYMETTANGQRETVKVNGINIERQANLPRISKDPTVGEPRGYIDIGVYEYMKTPLIVGNEVDILWVSTKEHPENGAANGATWKTPTSDLQRAIETLLASRNGHKKEIRIMEGEYTPVKTYTPEGSSDTYQTFYIDTKSLNGSVITPNNAKGDAYYAQSITIKGGYSSTIEYDYDPALYKTIIRQEDAPTGVKTDRLIYIADPTLRYAKDEYTSGNELGAKPDVGDVTTMPVQVDGVTLINDKAAAETVGSAIYYPDYADVTKAHTTSVGGVIKYYTDETHTTLSGEHADGSEETDYPAIIDDGTPPINNPAKILITKTMVIGSGNPTSDNPATASAVYIGKNGGSALIYNTVFHSNYGMPLNAWNTVNVNNTFGLNGGLVNLQDASGVAVESQMHNSVLWKNYETNVKGTYNDQVHISGAVPTPSTAKFSYNSFTGATVNESLGITALVNDNSNIGEGPNFVDPENVDIFARNFDIKPSIRLLNKGMDTSLEAIGSPDTNDGNYYTKVVTNKYDFSLASTTDVDVLNRARLKATKIDIGAYEFQGSLNSILYVDPNKLHDDAATGENWDMAFGYNDLQNAVDLASISHATDKTTESYVFVKGNSSTKNGQNTNETLIIRDGVTVYGSIGSDYTDWHNIPDPDEPTLPKYRKSNGHDGWEYDIDKYIEEMKSKREGVASDAASKTIVTGIKTSDGDYDGTPEVDDTEYNTPALIDGFVVTDPNSSNTPVVDITNTSKDAIIVVRNVVVADNNITDGANVAQISNGLIYEALFRDNQTEGAALKVANYPEGPYDAGTTTTRGFAVNVTVEGKTIGADGTIPVDGVSANGEAGAQIFKSITNSIDGGTGTNAAGANAPYKKITNPGISGYFYNIADPNLNYQLTETSKYIDICSLDVDANGNPNFLPENLKPFVHYTTDRDILGNPRLLTGVTDASLIDRGAFETWKVKNTATVFKCGDNGTIANAAYNATYNNVDHALIKKHFYPHDGSVCYIMEGQSLVIDAWDPLHEVKPTPHNPGFMLVKNGANFYGNGRPATCAYLAVERNVPAGGAIISVPYAMQYRANVAKNTTPTGAGQNDLVLTPDAPADVRNYDGSKRSDWRHIFQETFEENNPNNCWIATGDYEVTAANNGVFYKPSTSHGEGLYRFTAKGANLTDYIYTETTDTHKDVALTKYDDAESTNDKADFTDNLDMSWNCFGIPYLVSEYKPYERVDKTTAEKVVSPKAVNPYRMDIPHTLWLYYDGVHTPDYDPETEEDDPKLVNGDGGYYSVDSWESSADAWHTTAADARIWVGEGIFTQTATLNGTESLVFYRPVYEEAPTPAKTRNARYYYDGENNKAEDGEISEEDPFGDDAVTVIDTKYYTPNGILIEKPEMGVVIVQEFLSNGKTRSRKIHVK